MRRSPRITTNIAITIALIFGIFVLLFTNTHGGTTSSLAALPSVQQSPAADTPQSPAQKYFSDVMLTNQHGENVRFYSDLIKDKVVVINCFFSTCKGSCLPLIRNMHNVQTALGDKVGSEVYLISISVDPMMDTPERLKQFAEKNGAKPGWFFVSGEKANVELALRKLGQYVDKKEDHLNIFIIGNERTGLWKKAFGLAKSEELVKVVQSVLNDTGTTP